MTHPKQYLMEKIVGYQNNGFASLGQLHAKHTNDIIKMLADFAEESILDVIERINNGETILVKDKVIGPVKRSAIKILKDK
jgi:hypothetical protein